ncbi:MAG: carbohydrate kinase [Chloroflexi bacterium]|nr:MAG: carbohydrate kinase [Chloroflexota bacterium]
MTGGGSLLLGIDIGTSATKLVLLDPAAGIVAEASTPAGYQSPHPGWAEANADGWWRNVCSGVPKLLELAGIASTDVAGIGVSGMVPAIVLLGDGDQVLRPSIQQNDARAVAEIDWIRARTEADDILRRTGSPVTQQSVGPKIRWLRAHEPEVMASVRHVCGSYDFIVHRLTGEWSLERNWALESGLYDLATADWDDDMLALTETPRAWLAPIRRPTDIVGPVSAAGAAATGLAAGTPVAAGTADHVASAFSAGVIHPGDLLVKLGSSGDVLYCTPDARVDSRLFLDFHLADDRFLPNGCMAASGSLLVWFRDNFAPGLTFASLDKEAAAIPEGSDGLLVLPYFLGEKTPIFNPRARGTIVGLTLSHGRGHLFRSLLEGISLGFRHHLEVFRETGTLPVRARCTNGGADSALWRQITADVLGLPLERLAGHPGSSLGAAFVAGRGLGLFSDWEEIERFVVVSDTVEPNSAAVATYDALYPLFRETYERLKDLYPRLSGAAQRAAS